MRPAPRPFGPYLLLAPAPREGAGDTQLARLASDPRGNDQLLTRHAFLQSEAPVIERDLLTLQAVRHDNVQAILDFGVAENQLYVTVARRQGRHLGYFVQILNQNGVMFGSDIALHLAAEAAAGLAAAHEVGVAHGGISPRCLFLGADGRLTLVGFHHGSAGMGEAAGYLSPEQAEGSPADAASDVFSLGVVLWELLTGRRLFLGRDAGDSLRKILAEKIAPPSAHNSGLPKAVDEVVLRALQREPELRYQSATEFRDHLRAILKHLNPGFVAADVATYAQEILRDESAGMAPVAAAPHPLQKAANTRQPVPAASGHYEQLKADRLAQFARQDALGAAINENARSYQGISHWFGYAAIGAILAFGFGYVGLRPRPVGLHQNSPSRATASTAPSTTTAPAPAPGVDASGPAAAVATREAAQLTSPTTKADSAVPALGKARFTVDTRDVGYEVLVNGAWTPVVNDTLEIPAGVPVTLLFRKPGFENVAFKLEPKEGEHLRGSLKFQGELKKGFLQISTAPEANYQIYRAQELVGEGRTPALGIELPIGRYRIVLENSMINFRAEYEVQIEGWKTTTFRRELLGHQ